MKKIKIYLGDVRCQLSIGTIIFYILLIAGLGTALYFSVWEAMHH